MNFFFFLQIGLLETWRSRGGELDANVERCEQSRAAK